MIDVWIDRLTPCLVESLTGDIVQTEVVRLKRKSFLKKYSKRTGWYLHHITINNYWSKNSLDI
jgi:hypothetical protein